MRIVVVQYAGDYLAAYRRLEDGGGEEYYAHEYVLNELARLVSPSRHVTLLCCRTSAPYDVTLPSGLRLVGAAADPNRQFCRVQSVIRGLAPSHLVLLGPMELVLCMALLRKAHVLCVFADSFEDGGLAARIRRWVLRQLMNRRGVEWVANHGVSACASLRRLGVKSDKLIAWDWPHKSSPADSPVKSSSDSNELLYVGALVEDKGIGDVIRAISELQRRGRHMGLSIVGSGDVSVFERAVSELGIERLVTFHGPVRNDLIVPMMRAAFAVVVPSRPSYPEGFPLTIFEALASRTPIVASNHPMFKSHLADGMNALVFRAGDPHALADQVERLADNSALYRALSERADETWEELQIPTTWGELIRQWVLGESSGQAWLEEQSAKTTLRLLAPGAGDDGASS